MYDRISRWIVHHAFEFNLWLAMVMAFTVQIYVQRKRSEQAKAFDRILSGFICSLLTVAVILPSNINYNLFMFIGIVIGAMGIEAFLQIATKIADNFINNKILNSSSDELEKSFSIYRPKEKEKKLYKGQGRQEPPMPRDKRE